MEFFKSFFIFDLSKNWLPHCINEQFSVKFNGIVPIRMFFTIWI